MKASEMGRCPESFQIHHKNSTCYFKLSLIDEATGKQILERMVSLQDVQVSRFFWPTDWWFIAAFKFIGHCLLLLYQYFFLDITCHNLAKLMVQWCLKREIIFENSWIDFRGSIFESLLVTFFGKNFAPPLHYSQSSWIKKQQTYLIHQLWHS